MERSNFRGCPIHRKALGVSAAVYAAKGSSIMVLQPTAVLPTGRCHIILSIVKNPPLLQCGLSLKFDHLWKSGPNTQTQEHVPSKWKCSIMRMVNICSSVLSMKLLANGITKNTALKKHLVQLLHWILLTALFSTHADRPGVDMSFTVCFFCNIACV